jgi:hypothetical protein
MPASVTRCPDPGFVMQSAAEDTDPSRKVYFTGEMIFPWMFDDLVGLRPFKALAHDIASYESWSVLYDSEVLRKNTVPVAAATYVGVRQLAAVAQQPSSRPICHPCLHAVLPVHNTAQHIVRPSSHPSEHGWGATL